MNNIPDSVYKKGTPNSRFQINISPILLHGKSQILENIYGMRNFYKPGWHFPIDNNLIIQGADDVGPDYLGEIAKFSAIRDIKLEITRAIVDEGERIEKETE